MKSSLIKKILVPIDFSFTSLMKDVTEAKNNNLLIVLLELSLIEKLTKDAGGLPT